VGGPRRVCVAALHPLKQLLDGGSSPARGTVPSLAVPWGCCSWEGTAFQGCGRGSHVKTEKGVAVSEPAGRTKWKSLPAVLGRRQGARRGSVQLRGGGSVPGLAGVGLGLASCRGRTWQRGSVIVLHFLPYCIQKNPRWQSRPERSRYLTSQRFHTAVVMQIPGLGFKRKG